MSYTRSSLYLSWAHSLQMLEGFAEQKELYNKLLLLYFKMKSTVLIQGIIRLLY